MVVQILFVFYQLYPFKFIYHPSICRTKFSTDPYTAKSMTFSIFPIASKYLSINKFINAIAMLQVLYVFTQIFPGIRQLIIAYPFHQIRCLFTYILSPIWPFTLTKSMNLIIFPITFIHSPIFPSIGPKTQYFDFKGSLKLSIVID